MTTPSLASTIVDRYQSTLKTRTKTAKVIHRSPSGIAWGWWSPSPPRMHVRPMSPPYQGLGAVVWLERDGVRAFEPVSCGGLPPGEVEHLFTWVTYGERNKIERAWLAYMSKKGWLDLKSYDLGIVARVYRGTGNEREVKVPMGRVVWMGTDDGSDARVCGLDG